MGVGVPKSGSNELRKALRGEVERELSVGVPIKPRVGRSAISHKREHVRSSWTLAQTPEDWPVGEQERRSSHS